LILHLVLWIWVAVAAASTLSVILTYRTLAPAAMPSELPQVVVLVAIRDAGPMSREFFQRLRAQSYSSARIVVAVESAEDPAYDVARLCEQSPGLPMTTITVGPSVNVGHKVANLLGAVRALIASDEIVAFVDADTLPHEEWLVRLVMPILERRAEAVTGYRWLFAQGEGWGGYWVAATNNAIASMARSRFWNVAWGGSFAIRRPLLDHIEIASWWKGALSDDLQMTRALWAHGIKIVYARGGLVPTPIRGDLRHGLEFGRRQFLLMRTHIFVFWAFATVLVTTSLAALALAVFLVARGDVEAIAALCVIFAMGQFRGWLRSRIAAWVLRDSTLPDLASSPIRRWVAELAQPWFHLACLAMSLSSRRLKWAGIDYKIIAPQRVRRS
jgi:cellulose synthase/poly-beta-1,6-N-acetylglucosamine synthase-like glycosyltransferase